MSSVRGTYGYPLGCFTTRQGLSGKFVGAIGKRKISHGQFHSRRSLLYLPKVCHGHFDKADQEDRNGTASKTTARTFYAAANFLQILEQFEQEGSDDDKEDRKKIIYAKWKATDILKALNEGRTPTPGGYGEENEDDDEEEEVVVVEGESPVVETVQEEDDEKEQEDDAFDLPPAAAKPMPALRPVVPPPEEEEESDEEEEEQVDEGQEVELGPTPAYPGPGADNNAGSFVDRPNLTFDLPAPVEAPPAPPKKSGGLFGFGKKQGGKVSKAKLADATELTRFALAALEDKDAELAAERLKQALSALGR